MQLIDLGWNDFFEANFFEYNQHNFIPARVARENKNNYLLLSEYGELTATVTGKMLFEKDNISMPVVGDWVAVKKQGNSSATIHSVLTRQSSFERKVAGAETKAQIVASNVNTVFLVNGLDDDFNPRRIERYVTTVWDSGAKPVIILNKADVCDKIEERKIEVESVAFGVPIFIISALTTDGIDELNQFLTKGSTVALIGSSGVGKSTIINHFLGYDKMVVKQVSDEKSKGRHTTTHRELILLDNGALFIDTPGMRELQLWGNEESLKKSFEDIELLSENCRFDDCQHQSEPGCAIKEAIENGEFDQARYNSFLKLLDI